ncbi:hypothetical protein [Candidatus Solirubrobacter pratensis]|uniref:hypothetical protein n=1 Tax=Candidatus Solirubrobacter pratensis TaxID=1298857 RepID=UPI000408CD20|nr:hypothetical protein [Candidatus Solirubrobacter pratensis]
MVAHAFEPVPRLGLLRLRVALIAPRLDSALAAGIDPVASSELALRAGQLVSPRRRAGFARSLVRAVQSAQTPRLPMRGASVPVNRAAVREARPALLALADDLVEVLHPCPRGVALAVELLRDGAGPLYRPHAPAELHTAAERARHAL